MVEFILAICAIVGICYLIIKEIYISKEYILEEIDNKQQTNIRGNYIDISFKEERIRIYKKKDNYWYWKKNDEEQKIQHGEIIKIGNKEFKFIEREKKGGFFVTFSLFTALLTIFLLYYQGITIMHNLDENTSETDSLTQTEYKQNLDMGKEKTEENTEEKVDEGSTSITIDENESIHSIVSRYDSLFQNNIMIDWNAYHDNGKEKYVLDNNQSEIGLNATNYQGNINWAKVKADGIDFALIHIGSRGYETGKLRMDPRFKDNIEQAIANNIKVGTTFYSQAINKEEMDEEIEMMVSAVKDYKLDYPISISLAHEDDKRAGVLSDEEYIEIIKYFCIRIKQKGYTPMILGKEEWYHQFSEDVFDGYLKLVANDDEPPSDINNCIIWGYDERSKGKIDGIEKNTEVSIYLSGYINNTENDNK